MLINTELESSTKKLDGGLITLEYVFRVRTKLKSYVCRFSIKGKNSDLVRLYMYEKELREEKFKSHLNGKKVFYNKNTKDFITNEDNSKTKELKEKREAIILKLKDDLIYFKAKTVSLDLIHATDGISALIFKDKKFELNLNQHIFFSFFYENGVSLKPSFSDDNILKNLKIIAINEVKKESREKSFISF